MHISHHCHVAWSWDVPLTRQLIRHTDGPRQYYSQATMNLSKLADTTAAASVYVIRGVGTDTCVDVLLLLVCACSRGHCSRIHGIPPLARRPCLSECAAVHTAAPAAAAHPPLTPGPTPVQRSPTPAPPAQRMPVQSPACSVQALNPPVRVALKGTLSCHTSQSHASRRDWRV